ncbi:MAG TPA: ABC transporter permease [Microbacteriaceae bacterium]|nr:ABC transporter permease [Microbacteriaceae bacterium]
MSGHGSRSLSGESLSERSESMGAATRARRFGTWYVFEHLLREARSYGVVTIAQAIGTPLIGWLAFGIGVGALVQAGTGGAGVEGVPYLAFVFPALMCGLALQVWAEDAMFGTMLGIKWRRTFVAMRAAPIEVHQIVGGVVGSIALRAAVTAILYAVVAAIAGAFSSPWAWASVLAALAGAAAFGMPLMAFSARMRRDVGQFALIGRFVIVPLTLFSGTMFPLATLPVWLQWIGWVSPLWHASQLARAAAYGPSEPLWLIAVHILVLLGLIVLGWWLTVRALRRRLEQ